MTLSRSVNTLLIAAVLLLVPCFAAAQGGNIRHEIMNYGDSVTEIISKGRRMLYDKLAAGELDKVKQIKDFLETDPETKRHYIFNHDELCLIRYWTKDYGALLADINEEKPGFRHRTVLRGSYMPGSNVYAKSVASKQRLLGFIDASGLDDLEKDLLRLNLEYLLMHNGRESTQQDTINRMADDYFLRHPGSIYEEYIRKNIRYKYVPSAFGFRIGVGSGCEVLTGSLSKDYTNMVPFVTVFGGQYRKWALDLTSTIGNGKTRRDVPYGDSAWYKGSAAQLLMFEGALGYVIADNRLFKIAPFAGMGIASIKSVGDELKSRPSLKEAGLRSTAIYSFGLTADIKVLRTSTPGFFTGGAEDDYWYVNIRYTYGLPQFGARYAGMTGSIQEITVGFGVFGRKIKRNY